MANMRSIRLALLVFGMSICVAAQTSPQSQPGAAPAPAFGQTAPVLNPDNPPVSGLDQPSLELRTASRSFISPALQVSESADTNGANQLGGSPGLESVTRVLGALDLQQFWPKSDLFLEYLGGGSFYSRPYAAKQMQAAGLEAVTRWRTGQVTLRDAFNYLPDGSFAISAFGGVPGLGIATGGGTAGLGGGLPGVNPNGQLGAVGNIPRLSNRAIVNAVQALSKVSALTAAVGFSNAHFYDPTGTLLNSDEITVEGGYSHLLRRHDQIGAVYAFQLNQFPQVTGGQVYVHTANLRWSHTITGRMNLIAGVGPQYIDLQNRGDSPHWSVSARVQLRYKFAHSSMIASYEKFTSAGSGFFAGAETQAVRLAFQRPLARTWNVYGDVGYSHNKKLQTVGLFGVAADSYNDVSASVIFRKHLGRTYDFFAAYRFSEVAFNVALPPLNGFGGGRNNQRQVGTIGVEWHPTPTRIE
jgi:hypothetical protein